MKLLTAAVAGLSLAAIFVAWPASGEAQPARKPTTRAAAAKSLGQFTHGGEKTVLMHANARWEKLYDDSVGIGVLLTEKPLPAEVAAAFAKGDDLQEMFQTFVESWTSGLLHLYITPEGKVVTVTAKRPGLFTGAPRDAGIQASPFSTAGGRVAGSVKAAIAQGPGGGWDFAVTFDAPLPPR